MLLTAKRQHAFDDPALLRIVERYAPEYIQSMKTCARPALSRNPDELEQWEAKQVLLRKERLTDESDYAYLVRVLYEESFSVQQIRDVFFRGSGGFTPGGLISHGFINRLETLGTDPEPLVISGSTLREALERESSYTNRRRIVELVFDCTYPYRFGEQGLSGGSVSWTNVMRRIQRDPAQAYPEDVDALGFRLLRLMMQAPWLMNDITDEESRKRFGFDDGHRLTLARAVYLYWEVASKLVLPTGYFVPEDVSGADERLKLLLELRTRPELAVVYRYLSASGCLNSLAETG